jgi:hypothetical protein
MAGEPARKGGVPADLGPAGSLLSLPEQAARARNPGIADLVGHKGTMTTETVYRKVIVPELRRGAEVMDRLFS